MQLQDLSGELSDALGYVRGRGVLITAVEPDSPATEAGIQRGLVIYRVGKSDVSSGRQIEELLQSVDSGTSVPFTVGAVRARGQNHLVATVELTAR
jgi:S1-C subfamily serine protease